MTTKYHDRGQVVIIEVILLLALLITVIALYQAFGVPDQNNQAEFEHNQEVQSDLLDLRNSLLDVRSSRESQISRDHRSIRVRLGLQYPSRILGINPPDPQGTLRTQEYGEISIKGATVAGQFNGDPEANLLDTTHDTKTLMYEPGYNEYPTPPITVLEHSLGYNQLEFSDRSLTKQRIVSGESNAINIVLFDGDIHERGYEAILDPKTIDGPTERVPIEAEEAGEDFEIVLPTKSPEVWTSDRVIGEAFEEGEQDARAEATGEQEVTITLRGDESWTLQMTRVGYDGGTSEDTLSAIQENESEPQPGDHNSVYGPSVTINEDEIPSRVSGEEIGLMNEITGEISSIGSESRLRSGTPIQSIVYTVTDEAGDETESGTVVSLDPDESDRVWNFDEGTIDTDGWEPGEYTVSITAQDASGRITAEEEVDSFVVTIESDELFTDARVSDLIADQTGQTQTFEFDLSQDLGAERVTIDIQDAESVTYPGQAGSYTVTSGSGTASIHSPGNPREIRYEATASDEAGDTIEIEVNPTSTQNVETEYEITISARDGNEVITTTFTISPAD